MTHTALALSFVELPTFSNAREAYLSDNEFRQLQQTLFAKLEIGDLVPRLGRSTKTPLVAAGHEQAGRIAGDLLSRGSCRTNLVVDPLQQKCRRQHSTLNPQASDGDHRCRN